ncbi:MAG: hypothetical protein LN413_00005 [Candidatus Thermoplasmatota archaeon]|nr:hypothetical protein [Candidatus Thermoplasmatota archaeon]
MGEGNIRSPSKENYSVIGGVRLFFLPDGKTLETDWLDIGDVHDVAMARSQEALDHFTLRKGERVKDLSIITQREGQLNFQLHEPNLDNLMIAFGKTGAPTQTSIDVRDAFVEVNPGSGSSIDLGVLDVVPGSVIVRTITREVLDEIVFVEGFGQDFKENPAAGTIDILAGGQLADPTAAPEFAKVHVLFRKNVEVQQFKLMSGDEINGKAAFVVVPKRGPKLVYDLFNVQIQPNGDTDFGDGSDWWGIPLTMMILADKVGEYGTINMIKADELP